MTPDQITALINLGSAGAVIIVVVYFLRYIGKRDTQHDQSSDKRDAQWQTFLQEQRERDNTAIRALVDEIKCLSSKFDSHDEKMDTAITRMDERTKVRKAGRAT